MDTESDDQLVFESFGSDIQLTSETNTDSQTAGDSWEYRPATVWKVTVVMDPRGMRTQKRINK
jgi:hypothetical protein